MKPRKFVGCESRDQAKFPDRFCGRANPRPLVWLLASAMAGVGTADLLSAARPKTASASPAQHQKPASHDKKAADASHPKKTAEAEHGKAGEHKKGADHKKGGHHKDA